MENKIEFPQGINFYKPHENAPEWVKGQIVINFPELLSWANGKGIEKQIRLDLKKSSKGNFYLQQNTWKKPVADENDILKEYKEQEPTIDPETGVDTNEIPF